MDISGSYGSIANAGVGAGQLLGGLLLKKGKRPEYNIPGAEQEALSIARQQAGASTRPGNEYSVNQIRRNAGSSLSFLRRGANSASQLIAGAQGINSATNQAIQQNNAQNSVFRFNSLNNLQNALGKFSMYQDKAFTENQLKPYQSRVETKNALIGAGLQNIAGAAQDFGNQSQQSGYLKYLMNNPGSYGFGY